MTEKDMLKAMSSLKEPPTGHPAWNAFVQVMRNKQYGWDPLCQAWAFFRKGWDAHKPPAVDAGTCGEPVPGFVIDRCALSRGHVGPHWCFDGMYP